MSVKGRLRVVGKALLCLVAALTLAAASLFGLLWGLSIALLLGVGSLLEKLSRATHRSAMCVHTLAGKLLDKLEEFEVKVDELDEWFKRKVSEV